MKKFFVVITLFFHTFSFSSQNDPSIFFYDPTTPYKENLLPKRSRCILGIHCLEETKNFCGFYGGKNYSVGINVAQESFEKLLKEKEDRLNHIRENELHPGDKEKAALFLEGFKLGTFDMLSLARKADDLAREVKTGRFQGRIKSGKLGHLTKAFNNINEKVGWKVGDFLLSIPKENAELIHKRLNEYRSKAEQKLSSLRCPKKKSIKKSCKMKRNLRKKKQVVSKKKKPHLRIVLSRSGQKASLPIELN